MSAARGDVFWDAVRAEAEIVRQNESKRMIAEANPSIPSSRAYLAGWHERQAEALAKSAEAAYARHVNGVANMRNGGTCLVCGCYASQHDHQTQECPTVHLHPSVAATKPRFCGTVQIAKTSQTFTGSVQAGEAMGAKAIAAGLPDGHPFKVALDKVLSAPAPAKPDKPIHEMTFADYQRGIENWWPSRAKS